MITIEEFKRYPHFSSMSNSYLQDIAKISHEMAFESGERLFREGNTATHLMFVKSGEISIVYLLGDGREVIADTLVTGDTMAWSAVLAPHRLTASGVGSKDGSVIMIEAKGLRALCEEHTDFGYSLMREIARILRSRLSAMRVHVAAGLAELV